MQITDHGLTYTWHENWAKLPDSPSRRASGRTHGVAALPDGRVVVFYQADPAVLILDARGDVQASWGERFVNGAHGLTLSTHDGEPALWLVDTRGEVVKTTLDGETIRSIPAPDHVPADAGSGKYAPTNADENPANGEVWVSDGYGTSLVRRYDRNGKLIATLDGTETSGGAGRFRCPHGVNVSPAGELWVADRGNHRVAVYDLDGKYLRHRDDVCHSPCSFAFHDGKAYLPELWGAIKILNADLSLVAELGANPAVIGPDQWPGKDGWSNPTMEGWPNVAGTDHIQVGKFNSPHGITVAPNGDIYVGEWIVGGRVTKLEAR